MSLQNLFIQLVRISVKHYFGTPGENRTHITVAYLATAVGVYKAPALPILATGARFLVIVSEIFDLLFASCSSVLCFI